MAQFALSQIAVPDTRRVSVYIDEDYLWFRVSVPSLQDDGRSAESVARGLNGLISDCQQMGAAVKSIKNRPEITRGSSQRLKPSPFAIRYYKNLYINRMKTVAKEDWVKMVSYIKTIDFEIEANITSKSLSSSSSSTLSSSSFYTHAVYK